MPNGLSEAAVLVGMYAVAEMLRINQVYAACINHATHGPHLEGWFSAEFARWLWVNGAIARQRPPRNQAIVPIPGPTHTVAPAAGGRWVAPPVGPAPIFNLMGYQREPYHHTSPMYHTGQRADFTMFFREATTGYCYKEVVELKFDRTRFATKNHFISNPANYGPVYGHHEYTVINLSPIFGGVAAVNILYHDEV